MATRERKTTEVFGIQRDVPENYVTRPDVDAVFVENLTRDKHIVVFGSSKQGKTSLRKYNLRPEDYITVTCSNTANLSQLHSSILKEAGFTIEQSTTRTVTGESKINARFGGELNLGVAKIRSDVGADDTSADSTTVTEVALTLDPSDVNDIIRALEDIDFDRYVVLEDFHYLPTETQESFSVALKAFHENSDITFIIVGVWLDENRLVQFNGDLTGRVLAIDADAWSEDELQEVIERGQDLLNVNIDEGVRERIIRGCFESVYIVQEACYRLCIDAGIHFAQQSRVTIAEDIDVDGLVRSIVSEQSARYDAFLTNVAAGFQETQLEMHKWLLLPVLMSTAEQLEEGVPWNTLRKIIDANHPSSPVNPGNVTQSLRSIASLQVRTKITPIILDYDQTKKRLNVVDRGFLIWLNYQDRAVLRDSLALPGDPIVPEGLTTGLVPLFDEA